MCKSIRDGTVSVVISWVTSESHEASLHAGDSLDSSGPSVAFGGVASIFGTLAFFLFGLELELLRSAAGFSCALKDG